MNQEKFRYESDFDLENMQLFHRKLRMKRRFLFWAEIYETNLNNGQYKPGLMLKIRSGCERKLCKEIIDI